MGTVFIIEEVDMIDEIKNKLSQMKESGELRRKELELQGRVKANTLRPKPIEIKNTTTLREFIYDPTFTAEKDIYDNRGLAFIKRGTKANPFDHLPTLKNLLIIDGDNGQQVNWSLKFASENPTKIILVNGTPIELMDKHKVRFYFDQEGLITTRLGIRQVPAIVSQKGNVLLIKEFIIEDNR